MIFITINEEDVMLGINQPNKEVSYLQERLHLNDKFKCERFPNITTIEDLSLLLHDHWDYGELFYYLLDNGYSLSEADKLMDNQYFGQYDSRKDMIIDLLDIPENLYELIDINKCMKKLNQLYLIFFDEDIVYLFTKYTSS